jgi:hypothetical protein
MWWDSFDYEYFRQAFAIRTNAIETGFLNLSSPPPSFNPSHLRVDSLGPVSAELSDLFGSLLANEHTTLVQPEQSHPIKYQVSTEDLEYERDISLLKSFSKTDIITTDFSDLELVEAAEVDEESPEWLELVKYDCRTLNFSNCDFKLPLCDNMPTSPVATELISDIDSMTFDQHCRLISNSILFLA